MRRFLLLMLWAGAAHADDNCEYEQQRAHDDPDDAPARRKLDKCLADLQSQLDHTHSEMAAKPPEMDPSCAEDFVSWQRASRVLKHFPPYAREDWQGLERGAAAISARDQLQNCVREARAQQDESEREERITSARKIESARVEASRAELVRLRGDPQAIQIAWSAYLCAARDSRSAVLAAMAQEKKHARLHALEDALRNDNHRIDQARAGARKALSCSRKDVAALSECWDQNGNATCDDLRARLVN